VECWPAPEIDENVNRRLLGALALSGEEERAIVAFLRTLSDL
jgi:cytochrome c peroxidase